MSYRHTHSGGILPSQNVIMLKKTSLKN